MVSEVAVRQPIHQAVGERVEQLTRAQLWDARATVTCGRERRDRGIYGAGEARAR